MGIKDYNMIFDELDRSCHGFLTADQLQEFHKSVYLTTIPVAQINTAIKQVCGPSSSGKVTRELFLVVLSEMERRRLIQEEAYWDFRALDYDGNNKINLKDALILFREFHGENFSLDTWKKFMSSREYPYCDIYYDEIRVWLCEIPEGPICTDQQLIQEERRLDELTAEWKWNEYEAMKKFEDDFDKEDHRESVSREANRKLNKWNRQGVEALLYDDGLGVDQDDGNLPLKPRNSVNINDLLDTVDQKYNILQDRLVLNMAQFAANMENEVSDIFQDLRRKTKQLIKDKNLTGNGRDLLGGMSILPYSLLALLGHHKSQKEFEEIKQELLKLKEEGKSEDDIRKLCEEKFENLNGGSKTAGDVLEDLENRRQKEKEYCLGLLHSGGDGKSVAMSINSELALLHHQHGLLGYESDINTSILTTGLGERSVLDKLNGLDELRSKKLVLLQLEEKKGRKQMQVSEGKITLDKLDNLGVVDLKLKVISEIDRKHFFEREAMISMLQGPDSKPLVEELRKLSEIERKKETNHLRNQHQNWLNNLSSFLPDSSSLSVHYKILHKAVCLCWLKHQAIEEKRYPNISDIEISTLIFSQLNLYQEAEVKQKIEEIQSMSSEELRKVIRKQHKYCINECFDGIANITMGTLVLSDDEKEFIEVLDEKYLALREKIFICMIQHKHGLDWINLDDKIKEKELHKLRKEEKKLRSTQNTEELAEFLGPKIMEMSSKLCYSLGSPKWITLNGHETKSENILSFLIERYDEEQQALISWLQTDTVKKLAGRKKRKEAVYTRLQVKSLKLELDLQTSYLMNGMIERLEDGEDTTRLTRLSEVSVKSWRDRMSHGILYKQIFQDLQNMKRDDITSWQLVYLTEVRYRHSDEREVLLDIVKEMSSDFLQEAAAMLGEGDRQKRLSELQTKYLKLDLSSKDDYEDYRIILEEAGAIQVICRKALLQKERRRGITAEMTAVSLLYDLYHQQFKELRSIYTHLDKIEEADLIERQSKERVMRKNNISPNVIKVLTVVKGAAHDHELLQVVDRKYDVLKDRLLLESIKQSMESTVWAKLSNKDKMYKVNKLKETTEIHWRQANITEFASVLGNDFNLTFDVKNIFGCDRESFRQSEEIGELRSETCSIPVSEVAQFLYDRLEEEKEIVLSLSQGSATGVFLSDGDKFALFSRLKREVNLCDDKDSLYLSSLTAGLLERQCDDAKKIPVNDQTRYKILAEKSIKWCEGEKNDIKIVNPVSSTDIMELESDVLKLLYIQHKQEQLDWYKILVSNQQTELRNTATVQSKQQRTDRLITLRNNLTALQSVDCKEYKCILLEAMVYKSENMLSSTEHHNSTMEDINIVMMSLLLQYQNTHAEKIILNFSKQTSEDLTWLSNQIISDQHKKKCQNIVEIVFSTETSTTESTKEDLLAALEGKYDALRDKLIVEALIAQYGELDWSKITDTERQKKVFEMKLKERRLRKEGKIDEVNKLIGDSLKHQEALTKLMGDNKADAERKLKERLEKRKQRLQEGKTEEECLLLEEEDNKKEEENSNILQELENRFNQEKDELLNQLSDNSDNTEDVEKLKQDLIKLRQDERKARNEDGFESAALVIGLTHKTQEDEESKKERQWRLAKERLLAARRKRGTGQKKKEDIIEEDIENITSKTRLREILLMLNDKNHGENRDYLIQLLEEVDADKIDVLSQLSNDDLESKINESCELRKKWKDSTDPNEDDELVIFKEISGCTVEIKGREKDEGYELDEVKVELLADLQHLQDIGTRKLRLQIPQKDIPWLKEKITEAKQGGNHDNVATILFLGQGQPVEEVNKDEHLVIAALEKKYDVMRDKLIVEALMREIGQAEWSRLTQLQKQKQVIQIKLENRRLRREGKMVEEISDLIKEHLKNTQAMDTLLSQSKREQHRRFEEKLASRRRSKMEREATMSITRENSSADQFQKYEEKQAMKKNILENLEKQLEADKERLLASLRNKTNKMDRVKTRWKMLAKLNQEQKLLLAEENVDSARIVFDMSESALRKEKSFIQERDRHRELAKGRLTTRGSPRKSVEENQQDILKFLEQKKESPKKQKKIKERVMENLYEHHQYEREIFVKLLNLAQQQTELQETAKNMSEKGLKDVLTKLQNDQIKIQSDAQQTALTVNLEALTEAEQQSYYVGVSKRRSLQFQLYMDAIVYRIEVELRMMKENSAESSEEVLHKELSVSLLADLQERQDNESSALRNIIVEKDDEMLENICGVQKVGEREGWFKNLSVVIFTLTLSSDDLELLPDITYETKKLEEEFEKQKQEITENDIQPASPLLHSTTLNSGENPEPKISELTEEYENKKQLIKEKYEKKFLEIRENQAAKKHAKDKKEMKEMEEKELVNMAEMRAKAMKTGGVTLRRKTSVLQDRLSIIREGKKDAEEKEKEKNPRSKSVDAKRSSLLKREKTALDIEVSDGQKQAMFTQIVRQQQNLQSKITDQQKQQEENLQKRLAAKRNQNEQAAALVNLGERQKTVLEQAQKKEKDRQSETVQNKIMGKKRSKSSDRT